MSLNYAKEVPRDKGGNTLHTYPSAFKANARYMSTNGSASSVISLNDNTTVVEVSAVGGPAAIRWVPSTETAAVSPFASVIATAGTTANFDNIVNVGMTRRFVVPIETSGTSSIVGSGVQAGTYRRIAVISAGPISSIITTEN